ncbi:M20 family metallopeptidase [Auritidibacter sp. NML100628]|uniref:M20 family metallopeptidase n=1 Tax=Auritidibacter sp. NML100628 TaxID=2170742 RepID=UPI000D73A263|nr:M20 family metallopeptidase [Auritidibacter sp. NML100628]PXA77861.1 glutamate carboxypeptidase [Auritidibacter sp. NML100628]
MSIISPSLVESASSRLADMLRDIQKLVEVESFSSDLEAVARGAEAVSEVISQRLGATVEILQVDGVTHLRLRFGAGNPKVVILTHQDTVWPLGTLERIPFSNDGSKLRGPGSLDMQTGVVMAVHATAMLQELGVDLDGLCILVTGDEEVGSTTSQELILSESQNATAVFVTEGAFETSLKIARKGTSDYVVAVKGRAAHAGLEPEQGINAGLALALLVPKIAGMSDPDQGTTVTPTVIKAGTTPNTVPASAQVTVDVRTPTREEQDRVDAEMRQLVSPLPGATVTVLGGVNRPPMERSTGADLLTQAQTIAETLGIEPFEGVGVGGASDGNFTAAQGIPTLDGMGACGAGAHADHEHALVEYIAPRTALLAAMVATQLEIRDTE